MGRLRVDGLLALLGGRRPGYRNGWDPAASRLCRRGALSSVSLVEPGRRYSFRYLGEGGRRFNDEAADAYEDNGMGAVNCILT